MLEEEYCNILCQVDLKTKDVADFKQAIKRSALHFQYLIHIHLFGLFSQYHHNWIVDNLPAASIMDSDNFVSTQYVGYPIGYTEGSVSYVYNHVNIIMEYHTVDVDAYRYYFEQIYNSSTRIYGLMFNFNAAESWASTWSRCR